MVNTPPWQHSLLWWIFLFNHPAYKILVIDKITNLEYLNITF